MSDAFTLPRDDQRAAILGRTGSGKTLAGLWQLSMRNIDKMPWIIVDFKGDTTIAKLKATELDITKDPPKKPGLYTIKPLPDENDAVDAFLWKVWERGKTGLMFDEGLMLTGMKSFRAILTQGRSKRIPCIILSQRPVWLDRFVLSESEHIQIFHLQDRRDRKTASELLPFKLEDHRLPEYHSYWYNVSKDHLVTMLPVPPEAELVRSLRKHTTRQIRAL